MATKFHNLSDYDPNQLPDPGIAKTLRFGIVVADWNSDVTYALLDGAIDAFVQNGVQKENIEVIHVPGTVELTYGARLMMDEGTFNGIIVIGCVIQGDTPHFDYVCQSVTQGVTLLNSKGEVPVVFSVLTTNTKQQALDRAGGSMGNKGVEGAVTALKMADLKV